MHSKTIAFILSFLAGMVSVFAQSPNLPDTPAGKLVAAYVKAFNSGDEKIMRDFVTTYAAKSALPKIPMEERMKRYRQMYNNLGGLELRRVAEAGESSIKVLAMTKSEGMVELTFKLETEPAHGWLTLEIEEAPSSGEVKIRDTSAGRDPPPAPRVIDENKPIADIESEVSKAADAGFSGAVLVAKGGRVLLSKGYGLANRERNILVKPDTVFDIGSIAKRFTAAAIFKLEQQGKLNVNANLSQFFSDIPSDKANITIEQLLRHSSGLQEYHGSKGDFEEMTKDEAVKEILGQKLRFEPGSQQAYSNSGFTLLAAIVEKASGKSFQAFLREQLFDPAGMSNTGFYRDPRWRDDSVARGYNGERLVNENSPLTWPAVTWALLGSGGIGSTVEDLYKWSLKLKGTEIFSEEARRKYLPNHPVNGFAGGNDFGFFAMFFEYPLDDVTVIISSNSGSDNKSVPELQRRIASLITDTRQSAPGPRNGGAATSPGAVVVREGKPDPPLSAVTVREGATTNDNVGIRRETPAGQAQTQPTPIADEMKLPSPVTIQTISTSPRVINEDKARAEIEAETAKAVEAGFSGAVLVAKGGKVLLQKGYGFANRERKIPIKPDTVFGIASVSKLFTIAAIIKLAQQGKLSVNDTLTKFFDNVPADKTGITVYQLLKHKSGLPEYHSEKQSNLPADFAELNKEEALRTILGQELKFEPGTQEAYSNPGYTLLAAVVEKASGKSFQEYLKEALFEPAGMSNTGFYGDHHWRDETVARGYNARRVFNQNSPLRWPTITWAVMGNGGMVSTVEDLYKWSLIMKGTKIFSEDIKQKYFPSRPVLARGGVNDFGFYTLFYEYPLDDATVIITSNSGAPSQTTTDLQSKIADMIANVPQNTVAGPRGGPVIVRGGDGTGPPPGAVIIREGPTKPNGGELPDTAVGRIATAYFQAFNSGDENVMKTFFLASLSKAAQASRPLEARLNFYRQVFNDLGDLKVESASEASEHGITVKARAKKGGTVEVRFEVDEAEPQKLKGFRLERR